MTELAPPAQAGRLGWDLASLGGRVAVEAAVAPGETAISLSFRDCHFALSPHPYWNAC